MPLNSWLSAISQPKDYGLLPADALVRKYFRAWRPSVEASVVATLTLLLNPYVAHSLVTTRKHATTLDPVRLLDGFYTAIYGDTAQVEVVRKNASIRHSRLRGELPEDVDAAQFPQRTYRANEDSLMLTVYVIFAFAFIQMQIAHCRLADHERDQWCLEMAHAVGSTFEIEAIVPRTWKDLAGRYEKAILGPAALSSSTRIGLDRLARTTLGDIPVPTVIADSSWLLAPEVASVLGVKQDPRPEYTLDVGDLSITRDIHPSALAHLHFHEEACLRS